MIVDKVFLLFAISIISLIIILLVSPILLQQGQDILNKQAISNGKAINKTLDVIRERTNIQLSQHTVHTDRELGDVKGDLIKLIKIVINLVNKTATVEDNVIGNLTDHRIIANITRDKDQASFNEVIDLLNQILNRTLSENASRGIK